MSPSVRPSGANATSTPAGRTCVVNPNPPDSGLSSPPTTHRLRSGAKPNSSARIPLIQMPASWPYMPYSPIVRPTRSPGPAIPAAVFTNTLECRNTRAGNTGRATRSVPAARARR